MDFRNTFLDAEPQFDLLQPGPADLASYDFVISSEVFEHIAPPIQPAFDNLARLLRPNGFVIFTVPWRPDGPTQEHFPNLYDWRILDRQTSPVLVNRTRTEAVERFEDLAFHGGPGQTLEMRFFSRDGLTLCLTQAGFTEIAFSRLEEKPEFGIVWEGDYSVGLIARKHKGRIRLWGLPCWKARIRCLLWHLRLRQPSFAS
jgi:SAM-dependent methyltransferase